VSIKALERTGEVAALRRPGEVMLVGPWYAFDRVSSRLLMTDAAELRAAMYPYVRDDANRMRLLTMYRRIMCTSSAGWQQSPAQVVEHVAGLARMQAVAAMVVPEAASDSGNSVPAAAAAQLQIPAGPVEQWPMAARFRYVLERARRYMSPAMAEEFDKLISPAAIGTVVGVLVVWAASHAFGVGEVVDVILIVVGYALAGWAIFDAVGHIVDFITLTTGAKNPEDLDRAARALADAAAAVGVGVLIAILTRGAGRLSRQAGGARRARAAEELPEGQAAGRKPVAGSPGRASLDPNEVRFSQNSVSYAKRDRLTGERYTYDDLVDSMRTHGWQGDPVDVVRMPDGRLTSMDNTRIAAAREAGIDVQATIRGFDEPVSPQMILDRGWADNTTWGKALTSRIQNQSGGFGASNPYGSLDLPRITGKPK